MIYLKTINEVKKIRESCRIVGKILKTIKRVTKPGITTYSLNQLAENIIEAEGAVPGFKGFKGYPFTLCTSINDIALHGFPDKTPLKEGDVLKVDVGVLKDGFYGDAATTIPVGKISYTNKLLLKCTRNALLKAIKVAKPNISINVLSKTIQQYVEQRGFNVLKSYGGHGIGRNLHEEPFIKNFSINNMQGPLLQCNMTICLEPVVTSGEDIIITHRNGWSICTKDGANTAHFEHTILIKNGMAEILTKN